MSAKYYEENHFLRGDRKLRNTDVELARLYGPLLKQLVGAPDPVSFKEFIKTAKKEYLPSHNVVKHALPVSTGRRLECLRLYLRFFDLPDLSAWISSIDGQHGADFKRDFVPEVERTKTMNVKWDKYIPDPHARHYRYHTFFDSLNRTALAYPQKDPADMLKNTLSKLRIKFHAEQESQKFNQLSQKSVLRFLQPYTKDLIEFIKPNIFYEDIAEDAFKEIIPGYRDL